VVVQRRGVERFGHSKLQLAALPRVPLPSGPPLALWERESVRLVQ
jgi:hypothetical protein